MTMTKEWAEDWGMYSTMGSASYESPNWTQLCDHAVVEVLQAFYR